MSSSVTIPKLFELQPLVATLIRASLFFTDVSNPLDPLTLIEVVEDVGLQTKKIEKELRNNGVCVVVAPILGGSKLDQSGYAWAMNVDIAVSIHLNPETNSTREVPVNIYKVIPAIVNALLMPDKHPGGEFFKIGQQPFTLSKFDDGLWIYDLLFTKEALL